MEDARTSRLFRFGVYELNEGTGELRKQGGRIRLQGQPFQILVMLLERPGELVTREDIRQRLWPEGTFVDFDHSLNTAVNKVRETLGDSATSPRFVETLSRKGYRFIATVEMVDPSKPSASVVGAPSVAVATSTQESPPPRSQEARRVLTHEAEVPQPPRTIVRALFFLTQIMYLCFYVVLLAKLERVQEIVSGVMRYGLWAVVVLIVTAVVGIPTRLYLIAAVSFKAPGLREKFLRLFPVVFPLDELWALVPFLLVKQIGFGLALATTAALVYLPFAQRSLILMGAGEPTRR